MPIATPPRKPKKKAWLRVVSNRVAVQVSALVFANAYVLNALRFIPCGYLQCSNCVASTFSCPLILLQRGAIMASMGMIGTGALWPLEGVSGKLIASMAGAVAILLLFGAALGTWGCGWLCPFGFVQDMIGKLRTRKFALPAWSGHLRIPLFAALVIAVPYYTRSLFFCDICPPGAINRIWQEAAGIQLFFKTPEGIMLTASSVLLAVVVGLSVFTSRPFCSTLCPIGGLHGLMNKISGLSLRVDTASCIACGRCKKACPQGIDPVVAPSHTQCTRCLNCTDACELIKPGIRL